MQTMFDWLVFFQQSMCIDVVIVRYVEVKWNLIVLWFMNSFYLPSEV